MDNQIAPIENEKWITKKEAEERYGIGARQLERYVSDGRLAKRIMPRGAGETRDPVCVLEADIIAIKAGSKSRPTSQSEVAPSHSPRLLTAGPTSQSDDATTQEEEHYTPEPRRPPRAWCSLDEAAKWSGLPKGWLRRAAETGAVRVIDVSGSEGRHVWRFNRDSLRDASNLSSPSLHPDRV